MITFTVMVWIGFLLLIGAVVALDLGVFHREPHQPSLAEAVGWSAVWLSLALLFNVGVYFLYELNPSGWDMDTEQLSGQEAAVQFLTGYIVEKSLSVDNIFVIAMIFSYFQVPAIYQHRVLFWGILGAVVFRGIMIVGGLALLERFDWLTYLLGAALIYSAGKMMMLRHDNVDIAGNPVIALVKRFTAVTERFHGEKFFVRDKEGLVATPLFLALVLVEVSDVMFAVDSIPAIFAITTDPFIVFTSNIFALLGLRSLYFVLAGFMDRFRYLKTSLVFLLAYIGVKLLLVHHYPIPTPVSLAVIAGIIAVGMIASTNAARDTAALVSPLADSLEKLAVATPRQARKALMLVLVSLAILITAAIFVLPGPPLLLVSLGLVVLAVACAGGALWLGRTLRTVAESAVRTGTGG